MGRASRLRRRSGARGGAEPSQRGAARSGAAVCAQPSVGWGRDWAGAEPEPSPEPSPESGRGSGAGGEQPWRRAGPRPEPLQAV